MSALSNFFKNWWNIYAAPSQTFNEIKNNPGTNAWIPIIIIMLVAVTSSFLTADLSSAFAKEQITKSEKYSDEQKTVILEKMESRNASPVMTVVPATIFSVIAVFVTAGVFYFVGNFFGGGKTTFKAMLTAVAFIGLIDVIATAVKLPMMLSQNSLMVQTSFALIFPVQDMSNFWYRLGMQLDFFRIWKIVLYVFAFKALYGYSSKKSSALVIPVWIVFIGVSLLAMSRAY